MHKVKIYISLTIITLIGLALRLYHNLDISLWHDEAFSALLIKYPWGEMFYRIGLDVHPPVYYVALRLWSYGFGDSLLALRGFSIFFGLLTAVTSYAFVKVAFKSERAALVTALLISLSPFQIQYATEARMYTFGAFMVLLSAYFLVKAIQQQSLNVDGRRKNVIAYFIAFGLVSGLAVLTHYYLIFSIAALCFYALCYHIYHFRFQLKSYLSLVSSYLLLLLVFAPWFKWFMFQFKQVGAGYWIPPLDRWSIPTTLWQMLLGIGVDITQKPTQILVMLATLFTMYFLVQFIRKSESQHKWLVLLAFLSPFAGSILFAILAQLKGESSSVYLVRYFLYTSSFYTIALAVWLTNIKKQWLVYVLLVLYVLCNLGAFRNYWQDLDIATKPGMNGVVRYLQENMQTHDHLVVGTSFEFFNLKYYLTQIPAPKSTISVPLTMSSKQFSLQDLSEDATVTAEPTQNSANWPKPLLFTGGNTEVSSMPHFVGTAILTNADLLPRFEDGAKSGEIIWLVSTNGFGSSKPPVPSNFEQLEEKGFAEVRPYVGTWITVTKYVVR